MSKLLASEGTAPIHPVGKTLKGENKIWKKWKEKEGGVKINLYKID